MTNNPQQRSQFVEKRTMTGRLKKLIKGEKELSKPRKSSVISPANDLLFENKTGQSKTVRETVSDNSNLNKNKRLFRSRDNYRVRRVRRLVRHIEPWSVLKVSLVFYVCLWGLSVVAVRTLWSAADKGGSISKVEAFIEDLFALETFEFNSEQIFKIFTLGGLLLVVGGTTVTVLMVVLFNLISDLTGGVRFTMIEEETAMKTRKVQPNDEVIASSTQSRGDREQSG